jgi:hypothetical protein
MVVASLTKGLIVSVIILASKALRFDVIDDLHPDPLAWVASIWIFTPWMSSRIHITLPLPLWSIATLSRTEPGIDWAWALEHWLPST